mmetsp:Transcript_56598/g.132802  ORF Transcript_56598/g.132802 Transcript_56598/m.132802 type:complete len:198 (+) Transcript_56598:79-672(+)
MHSGESQGRQKILMVGPCEAGKSTLANVLAENTETASELYRPTVGVRILEFDVELKTGGQQSATVELWDVAGDMRFRSCWPAVKKDAVGVVLVYNPERPQHEQEIEQWFQAFVKSMNLSPNQVMVIQTLARPDGPRKLPLPSKIAFAQIAPPLVVSADDLIVARREFEKFLEKVVQAFVEKQHQDEDDVMGQAGNLQ